MNNASFVLVSLLALPVSLGACSARTSGEDLAGRRASEFVRKDDGAVAADGGQAQPETGEACGSVTCGSGEVCCNPSCGICTAPGDACIMLACGDPPPPPPPPTLPACQKRGCSGEMCTDLDLASTCEWRPEFACYATATCERQENGQCGFTKTPAFDACLANPPP